MGFPKTLPYEFQRQFSGRIYTGRGFFETYDECKRAAIHVRKVFQVPARAVKLSSSTGDGRGAVGGYDERFCLMVLNNIPRDQFNNITGWLGGLASNMGVLSLDTID